MIDRWNFQEWLYMDRSFKICITFAISDFVVRSLLSAGGPFFLYEHLTLPQVTLNSTWKEKLCVTYTETINFLCAGVIWAPSSEFVSSSIPSWQILTAHAQPFRGARDLAFCRKVPLDSRLVWASSEGSGETARMCRLAWTFAARIGDRY